MSSNTATKSVGIIGARGYVGREFVRLLDHHPGCELTLAASASQSGASVREMLGSGPESLVFSDDDPRIIAHHCPDVLVLALPNGKAANVLASIQSNGGSPEVVIDLSADMRFDPGWSYCVPELHADRTSDFSRIANPGCYATAMQLALAPLLPQLASPPHCFGVSGYSGAGATPNPRNDTTLLEGGITPYAPTAHLHQKEVSHHLATPVRFSPSVAPFFRGIVLTAQCALKTDTSPDQLAALFDQFYANHPLIDCTGQDMPRVQDVVGSPRAIIGGLSVNPEIPTQIAVICVIDNLLKGAASQAIQNMNLALGHDPLAGVRS